MAVFFYNLTIRLYHLAIILAYPFHKKARLWIEGRKEFFVILQRKMYKNTSPLIWFHAASLGEFEQCRPLIEKIKNELPEYGVILTFFSPSGYEIRKNYDKANYVFYLPLDTAFNARKFVRVVNPKLALFAKYDFWHHYLNELEKKKIPAICFSAIFRKDQIFFKPYGGFFRKILTKFTRLFVQDENSQALLRNIGMQHNEVTGDTRFDRVWQIAAQAKTIPLIEEFKCNSRLLIAGSTWPEDIEILLPIINDPELQLKSVIAPHELTEDMLRKIEERVQKPCLRYSQVSESNVKQAEVLIIDNIGMLSSIYRYGYIAYVGGAFGKGLHNILEPACFGLPVFFGPEYKKFREATELIAKGGAFSVKSTNELKTHVKFLLQHENTRNELTGIIKSYVENNTGASQKIFNFCKSILSHER